MKPKLIWIICSLSVVGSRGSGQIVAYTFGTTGVPTTSANTVAPNTSASPFSSFAGSGAPSSSSPGSATAGGGGGSYFTANTFRSSDNNYFEFTITPSPGYQVSLTNVSFYYLATSSGPTNSAVQSSSDSYGSDLASFALTRAGASLVAADWHQSSSSVTLTFTSATTFRITGTGASISTGSFRIDNATLSGTVSAIPEPSTYAMIFGAAALAGAAWHRRRQKHSLPAPPSLI